MDEALKESCQIIAEEKSILINPLRYSPFMEKNLRDVFKYPIILLYYLSLVSFGISEWFYKIFDGTRFCRDLFLK